MATQNKLGQTVYYKWDSGNVSPEAWGGNVTPGGVLISKDEYIKSLQQKATEAQNFLNTYTKYGNRWFKTPTEGQNYLDMEEFGTGITYDKDQLAKFQQQISEAQAGQGIHTTDYIAPGFEKFNPYGMPDEANYTEAEKAKQMLIPKAYGGLGENKPGQLPLAGSPSYLQQAVNQKAAQTTQPTGQTSGYTGPSIVDYLKSVNQASDYGSRSKLAEQYGIKGYTGTAEQNTNLLNILRQQGAGGATTAPTTPTGATGALGEVLGGGTGADTTKSAKDQLIEKLLASMGGGDTTGGTTETTGLEKTVGDFNTEISKANDLLADLDQRIRGGVAKESGRLAPMELITGRSEELVRDASIDRNDLLNTIDKLTKGKANVLEELQLKQNTTSQNINILNALKGMSEAEKLDTVVVEANGKKLLVNQQTGEIIKDLGKASIGTTVSTKNTFSSGGMTVPDSSIATAQSNLDQSRGSDNYANSALYLQMLAAWKKDGGLEQDFFTQFPPKNYLNPNDTSIPQYIKDKLKATSSFDNL